MRFLIKFSYDGTNYAGYQSQPNLLTIQKKLEEAATKINNNKYTTVTATGRTDKHVHAKCQYAHLDIDVLINSKKLKRAMNSNLPDDIHVIEAYHVTDDFHSRYNISKKVYKYYLNTKEYDPIKRNYVYQYNYKLNIDLMQKAIKFFIGTHDFRAFVTENIIKDNCVRTIDEAFIEDNNGEVVFTFIGNGFMRYQVRNMVGILIKVGQEKIDYKMVLEILDSKKRGSNGVTAPAEGLYLENIEYNSLEKYIIE